MKRDMDLVRKILFVLEEHESGFAPEPLLVEGYSSERIGFHVLLMGEGGLLKCCKSTSFGAGTPSAAPTRLTWEGFDFLEAARADSTWYKAKKKFKDAGEGVVFEILKAVLVAHATKIVGL